MLLLLHFCGGFSGAVHVNRRVPKMKVCEESVDFVSYKVIHLG